MHIYLIEEDQEESLTSLFIKSLPRIGERVSCVLLKNYVPDKDWMGDLPETCWTPGLIAREKAAEGEYRVVDIIHRYTKILLHPDNEVNESVFVVVKRI